MRSIRLVVVAAVLATALAACSSNHPTVSRSPVPAPVLPAGQSASTSATPTPAPSVSTTVDPCQLVTPPEASALTGASYGAGKLEIDSPISRRCIYGAQTPHVFEVIFVQGSSPGQAKAYADALRAQAEQQLGGQVALSKLTGVGDDAESLHATLSGIDMAGVYVRQGTYGVALVDEAAGHAASVADLVTQAQTALGRLP
jgi:ABC-type phosphate/phosphonate transport system substrate-binding protein